ncbi:AraC-like DNA-binding protein [Chryseobacterium rhizosphaerae]|uniref:AraC-like DNA-binding protein n=1 Tax=Chryseobacterium rhizosphaerae TaxID=395937 RepID=A0AAE3YBX5_9FLAO|nr:helix-turn-helix domain-containing protein [Chryseobacterium rhizosphaerae]MDR6527907.1 AraC-like DNA-binding protein [Chryseobacterium rhizosphaerae]
MKTFPQEKILKDDKLLFAKWKTNTVSTKQFILMQENAFVFVLKGKKVIVQDGDILEINNQQLLILKKGVHKMTEYLAEDGTFEAIVIYFADAFIKHSRLFDNVGPSQSGIVNQDIMIVGKDKMINSFVVQYCNYILENENDALIMELKVVELTHLLLKKYPQTQRFFTSIIQQSSDLRSLVEKLYKENYSISQLAYFSNRSLSKFKRDFKSKFQCSPAKWILSRKLTDVRFYLVNTDKNMSEIADETGFESLSHLDKSFKRLYGITPSAFRNLSAVNQIDKP